MIPVESDEPEVLLSDLLLKVGHKLAHLGVWLNAIRLCVATEQANLHDQGLSGVHDRDALEPLAIELRNTTMLAASSGEVGITNGGDLDHVSVLQAQLEPWSLNVAPENDMESGLPALKYWRPQRLDP